MRRGDSDAAARLRRDQIREFAAALLVLVLYAFSRLWRHAFLGEFPDVVDEQRHVSLKNFDSHLEREFSAYSHGHLRHAPTLGFSPMPSAVMTRSMYLAQSKLGPGSV